VGFGSVATTAIMFIATVLTATALVMAIKPPIDDAVSSSVAKQQFYTQQLKTAITIEHAYHDSDLGITHIYVRNVGSSAIDPDYISILVGNNYNRVNSGSTVAAILADTETINPNILDKHEVLEINVTGAINAGQTYTIKATTRYDTTALYTMTVE